MQVAYSVSTWNALDHPQMPESGRMSRLFLWQSCAAWKPKGSSEHYNRKIFTPILVSKLQEGCQRHLHSQVLAGYYLVPLKVISLMRQQQAKRQLPQQGNRLSISREHHGINNELAQGERKGGGQATASWNNGKNTRNSITHSTVYTWFPRKNWQEMKNGKKT